MIYICSSTSPHSNQMSTRENRLLVRKTNNKIGSTGIDKFPVLDGKIDISHDTGI